jgi:hypothetical protein
MSCYYKDLDHASKVPFEDFMRKYSQVYFRHFTYRWWLWVTWSVRAIGKTLISLVRNDEVFDLNHYENFEWVLINDHNGHSVLFMDGIVNRFSNLSPILFLTCNSDLLKPSSKVTFKQNTFKSISFKSLRLSIRYSIDRAERFSNIGLWALPAFVTHIFDCSRMIEACTFYEKVRFSENAKLICLCDSHWHQSIVTSAFNRRALPTFTCMHGAPSRWDIMSPFNSNYVLSWGDRMSETILKNCKDMSHDRIISIGHSRHQGLAVKSYPHVDKFSEINEIVFISPCYTCSDTYGLQGLGKEITKFLELSVADISLAIRPYPYQEEIKFIQKLLQDMGLKEQVKVLTEPSFSDLVNPNRLFIGSVSSAIADVIINGGVFVGLCELLSRDLVSTNVCYSSDIYFNMKDLKSFLIKLQDDKMFIQHLDRLSSLRDGLVGPEIKLLDLYLSNAIEKL